jgi:hypothetical protein
MPDPAQRPRGEPLHRHAIERRGGLHPVAVSDAVAIPDADTFEKRRALGYVE